MNSEQFILELSKAMSVDGRVNVDRYCKVLELVNTYISSNYSKPIVSGSSSVEKRFKSLEQIQKEWGDSNCGKSLEEYIYNELTKK